ncbi:hypothetical protein AB0875_12720 [Micromonospora gifhornensis]|uniref:hypothetical protein n=1 Tax=Micromonospora gifhornensis TaxID=84594 RepID=UPI00345479F9
MADPTRLRMVGDAVLALAAAVLTPRRRAAAIRRDVIRHADLRIAQARKDKP